jgi:heme exporter protein D
MFGTQNLLLALVVGVLVLLAVVWGVRLVYRGVLAERRRDARLAAERGSTPPESS